MFWNVELHAHPQSLRPRLGRGQHLLEGELPGQQQVEAAGGAALARGAAEPLQVVREDEADEGAEDGHGGLETADGRADVAARDVTPDGKGEEGADDVAGGLE